MGAYRDTNPKTTGHHRLLLVQMPYVLHTFDPELRSDLVIVPFSTLFGQNLQPITAKLGGAFPCRRRHLPTRLRTIRESKTLQLRFRAVCCRCHVTLLDRLVLKCGRNHLCTSKVIDKSETEKSRIRNPFRVTQCGIDLAVRRNSCSLF